MYDYVDGKSDWMAYGLAVEGEAGPFLGQVLTRVPTCGVTATVAEAGDGGGGTRESVVVLDDAGLVVGVLTPDALAGASGDDGVLDAMDVVPSTVRPSVEVSSVVGSGADRVLVTSSDGRLLGQVVVADLAAADPHDGHDHAHDHGDQGAALEAQLVDTLAAVSEHFGDREPSEEELRAFLRDELVREGRTAEEADALMAEMDDPGS